MQNIKFTDNAIKYIIFDMDGVLIDSVPITKKAVKIALAEIGIEPNNLDFTPYIGTGEKNFILGPCKIFKKEPLAESAINRFYKIFDELAAKELVAYPSVLPLLETLRQKGLKLAIASSSAKAKVLSSLNAAHIPKDWFKIIITGDDVTFKKPSPEIYMSAINTLCAHPQNCLIVEDALSGITSAKDAGARCFGVSTSFNKDTLTKGGADFVGDDILEILDLI